VIILEKKINITKVIGKVPYRMAFAGGWIDQPFVSRHNPEPPGSMVVVSLEPTTPFMDRCGMGTSTRKVMMQIWDGQLPHRDPVHLMREAYAAENEGRSAPSGSQDMAGIIYPGINRLDYDFDHEGGFFPVHIESNRDPEVAQWLEKHIYMVPITQRPFGYDPLEKQNLDPEWIQRLGQTGKDCFDAIVAKDAPALGKSMNDSMICWEAILPGTVRHRMIDLDLLTILGHYQNRYCGAMYSGCGGGYIYVVSAEPVPGGFQVKVRVA
jgi:galactokinase/mevalonate kinase-like predicted kinase